MEVAQDHAANVAGGKEELKALQMKSSACKLICASLLYLEVTALVVTESKEQAKSGMHEYDDVLQNLIREDPKAMQLANDILTSLSRNDAAWEKQFKSAELAPASFTDLLSTVREKIQPLKGSMATLLQSFLKKEEKKNH